MPTRVQVHTRNKKIARIQSTAGEKGNNDARRLGIAPGDDPRKGTIENIFIKLRIFLKREIRSLIMELIAALSFIKIILFLFEK